MFSVIRQQQRLSHPLRPVELMINIYGNHKIDMLFGELQSYIKAKLSTSFLPVRIIERQLVHGSWAKKLVGALGQVFNINICRHMTYFIFRKQSCYISLGSEEQQTALVLSFIAPLNTLMRHHLFYITQYRKVIAQKSCDTY